MIELLTLGGLELRRSGSGVTAVIPLQPKRLALLAYLAGSPAYHLRRRDSLLALFWPDLDQDHARGALRQAVHVLRRRLGDGVILTRGEEEIGLDTSALWSDALGLETALQSGDGVGALSLYRGDFLDGVFVADSSPELEQWIAGERSRLRRLAAEAAWAASDQPAANGDSGQYVRRAVLLSGDDEAALRRGMDSLDRMGDRAGALALYQEFSHRVARELDAEPSVESHAAMQAVRARRGEESGSLPPGPPQPATSDVAIEASNPAPVPVRRLLARRLVAGAVLALAGLVLVVVVVAGRASSPPVSAGLVAVMPFRVAEADSSLAWLHKGVVELLSIRLAGDGGLRVGNAATVLTHWERQAPVKGTDAPHELALQVASRMGAARLIEGSVTGTTHRVTLSARLSASSGSAAPIRADVEGSPDSLPELLDQLAARLLGVNAGVEGGRVASLTSASLPAIRAFLLGREAVRRGRMEEAVQRYREATLLDSTFALAGLELSRAASWLLSGPDVSRGNRLANASRDRLSPADRALLDVIRGQWASSTDMFDKWNAVVQMYPDRPETWYGLGDAHYHWGPLAGEEGAFERATDAFLRGWMLDSAAAGLHALNGLPVAEPMLHLVELAQMRGDTAEVLRLAGQILAVDSASDLARLLEWHRAVVMGDSARQAFWAGVGSARERVLTKIAVFMTWSGVGIEDLPLAYAEDGRRLRAHDPGYAAFKLMTRAFNTGRPGDAVEDPEASEGEYAAHRVGRARIRRALAWEGDTAAARVAALALSEFADAPPMTGEAARQQLYDICTLGEWRAAHGDFAAVAVAIHRLRAAHLTGLAPRDSSRVVHYVALCSTLLDAMHASGLALADARNRVAAADSAATRFIAHVCCDEAVSDANLVLARLWEREGDYPRALRAARRRAGGFGVGPVYLSSFLREEGRLAALTGDTAGAVRAYRHYLALRRDPEPSVRPAVERVRRALDALETGSAEGGWTLELP